MSDDLADVIDPNCPGCRALLEAQVRIQREQAKQIESLEARIAQLEEQLGQDSGNSHQPPSTDPPGARERRKKRAESGRSRGGQKGHEGSRRDLVPLERVDHTVVLVPKSCSCCGERLYGADEQPYRHQVTELPPVRPTVTEYQQHTLSCGFCGTKTLAPLPDGVPTSAFGPRLSALVCTLTAHYRLSKAKAAELLDDVLGVRISVGGISRIEGRMSESLRPPVEEAQEHVQQQDVAYIDETGWRQEQRRVWLWAVVTGLVVVFAIRPTRGKTVAQELLGAAFDGVAVTDRYSGYKWLDALLRQLCWAHLIRDFRTMACARDPTAAAVGQRLCEHAGQLFVWWKRVKQGTLARSSFRTYASGLRPKVRQALEEGAVLQHDKVAGMCREMLRHEASMWTFVRVDGGEPTNNDAERDLRHGVVYRRICGGTASARGSRFVERMLTVRATLRRQGRNVLGFLEATADAANHHRPGPSLLPQHALGA